MKVVLVNCFDTYEGRMDLIFDYLFSKNYEVYAVVSNFKHIQKEKRNVKKINHIVVEVKPYSKNISFERLISHNDFSNKAIIEIEKIAPDLIYSFLPPNGIANKLISYRNRHPEVKVVFDLIDLWPETLPIANLRSLFPLNLLAKYRNRQLLKADYMIFECNYYKAAMPDIVKRVNHSTLYLAKKEELGSIPRVVHNDELNLCYLGSINNIIDIEYITNIVAELFKRKKVVLHIIGDGEKRDQLIAGVEATGARVEYYGKVFDIQEKREIFRNCHFALNIMKESVYVGLTMKSIDYFEAGLPILNNIKGDTEELTSKYNCGINLPSKIRIKDIEDIVSITEDDLTVMSRNSRKIYEEYFSHEAFSKKFNEIILDIIGDENNE